MITGTVNLSVDLEVEVENEEALAKLTAETLAAIRSIPKISFAEEIDCDLEGDSDDEEPTE